MRLRIPEEYIALKGDRLRKGLGIKLYDLNMIEEENEAMQTEINQDWLIIGHETICGDSVVIDLTDPSYRIGMISTYRTGHWEIIALAKSIRALFECLDIVEQYVTGQVSQKNAIQRIGLINGASIHSEIWRGLVLGLGHPRVN